MKRSRILAATLVASLAAPSASADTLCQTRKIASSPTNWTAHTDFERFDPLLGNLTSISIQVSYSLIASVRLESTDPQATVVQTTLQALFHLQHPDSTTLAVTLPQANFNDTLAPFDGVVDFAGPSGTQHVGLSASHTQSFTTASSSDLALFTGDGRIVVPVSVFAASSATASGNVVTEFTSVASAFVSVCYTYETDGKRNAISESVDMAAYLVPCRRVPFDPTPVSSSESSLAPYRQLRRSIATYVRSVDPV